MTAGFNFAPTTQTETIHPKLKAPMPYFGAKSAVASEIWRRLGNVGNYVEPFAGSAAVLLARPHAPKLETVNDFDGYIVNALRSLKLAPDETARYADNNISEQDLEARHYWLVTEGKRRLETILSDPDGHDPRVAGYWIWGLCCWIGSGWCAGDGPWAVGSDGRWYNWKEAAKEKEKAEGLGEYLESGEVGETSEFGGVGVSRQLPHLGDAGKGIHRLTVASAGGGTLTRGEAIALYFAQLSARLERVRICHGDFERVLSPAVTTGHGMTGILLDPPYGVDRDNVYNTDRHEDTYTDKGPAKRAGEWCKQNGDNPLLRIALCGYEGEYDLPGWTVWRWKANGGMANQAKATESRGKTNKGLETILFSPACLGGDGLFSEARLLEWLAL